MSEAHACPMCEGVGMVKEMVGCDSQPEAINETMYYWHGCDNCGGLGFILE